MGDDAGGFCSVPFELFQVITEDGDDCLVLQAHKTGTPEAQVPRLCDSFFPARAEGRSPCDTDQGLLHAIVCWYEGRDEKGYFVMHIILVALRVVWKLSRQWPATYSLCR